MNTTVDGEELPANCGPDEEEACLTLREAIRDANINEGADEISFAGLAAGSHVEVSEAPFDEITDQVTIDGDTAQGATAGKPAIELVPNGFDTLEGVPGLYVVAGAGTKIEGLAIGGFGIGIEVGPTEDDSPSKTAICDDYLGTDLSGNVAEPNEFGIEIRAGENSSEQPRETTIGSSGCENVISGNSVDGIHDEGRETEIANDLIGFGAEGAEVPNGKPDSAESAGVYVSASATGTAVGDPSGVAGLNTIWSNKGPGVLVEDEASLVTIRRNSFSDNAGEGIEIKEGAPAAPLVSSAVSPLGPELKVEGTVESPTPGEEVQLEFFGSDNCEKAGEGRTVLGSEAVENERAVPTAFTAHLPVEVPKDERGITVTATYANGATSELSSCVQDQRTYLVNTTEERTEPTECLVVSKCSLRAAIAAADETEVPDTIEFSAGAEGLIAPFTGFTIEDPVEIDGASAPGYEGEPVVEIDGSGKDSLGLYLTRGASGSTIRGLAVGGFTTGVALEGDEQRVCGSYLGVEADGTTPLPNQVGVSIEEGTTGDQIGAGCELLGDGNLISGNATDGINDFGAGAVIAGNRIGVDAAGNPLPNGEPGNGGAGIGLAPLSSGTAIGPSGLEGANVIADNQGPGVVLQRPANKARIRANSIYANEDRGIEIAEEAPVVPTITKVVANPGSTRIQGEVTAGEFEYSELDFFAGTSCEAGSQGGQTYLGDGETFTGEGGAGSFDVEVEALPAGEEYVTATTTGEIDGQTSEFSECFLSAPATERTFTVDRLGDEETAAGCEADTECTLRGAIEAADETENFDTIDFAESAEGVIEVDGFPLPEVTEPVEIDGTSAPGYAGKPVVEIDGTEADNEGPVRGLETGGAGGVTIKGLAIGGFSTAGVYLGGDAPSRLCSSWVGIELDGTTELPNGVGVETEDGALGGQIGVGCGAAAAPNVISANEFWGIEDFGRGTEIGGNRIGVLPGGGAAGNEEGGISVSEVAEGTEIGSDGTVAGAPESNQVTNNDGPGVFVESGLTKAAIRGNSIFANAGPGIEVNEHAPPTPTITSVESVAGTLSLEGEVSGGDGEEGIHLDFFASAACAAGTEGGQTYLGSEEVTSLGAPAPYEAEINGSLPAGEDYLTATETGSVLGQTSEFSQCFLFVPPPPRTFTVNSLGDGETAAGCEAETTCTLRGALEAANETEALDTIDFAVAGLIEPLTELPQITEGVDIDATTAPNYAGSPLFEIGGSEQLNNDGGTEGLVIAASAEGTTIKGLTVTRFDNGIIVDGNRTLLEADTVDQNGDIGVAVNDTAPRTAVRRSEIFANATGELRFETPNSVPEPELEAFVAGPTSTILRVPIGGGLPEHEYAIDVYADAHCEKPGEHGPMEVFLGSGEVTTDAGGDGRAEFTGVPLSGIDAEAFTVTATDVESGTTGGIGHCTYPPIDTVIESKPPAASGSNKATFTFAGETVGHVEGFECSLDAAAFAPCTSPEELTGLDDGSHTFKVRAFNGEGTRDFTPAIYEWRVDTEAPEITITAAPPAKTNSGSATFAFSVSDPHSEVSSVECSLDGAKFTNCESPQEYSGLAAGVHTFAVQAEDEAGNSSIVTREWKIVTEAPSPAITTGPPATTETTTATFAFGAAPGAEISGYECSLDGSAYAPCASPQSFGGLAPGAHAFAVRSKDEAGNISAPTVYRWTVAAAQVAPPGPGPSNTNPEPTEAGPTPTNGEKVVVAPVEGKVLIKLPGTNKYVPLQELKEIPVGAVIDATKGRVKLTSRNPDGTEQTAEFFEGVFRVKQRTGAGLVVLELLDTRVCPAPGATGQATASSLAARPTTSGTAGKLWGSGHGNFRTEGNDGSATVRGTIWLVEDRCNGTTFFKTRRDVVTVKDFITGKTFSLREGRTYLAGG